MAAKKSVKKSSSAKKAPQQRRNLIPLFVLVIMALSAALVAVLNLKNSGKIGTSGTTGIESAQINASAAPSPKSSASPTATASTAPDVNETKKIKVYFLTYDEKSGRILPGSVIREIKVKDELENALKETVKGPTAAEEKRGIVSALTKSIKIRHAEIKNGIADIDVSREFTEGIQGDAAAGRVNQIYYTATQIAGVKGIIIRVNGKPVKTLGSDGLVLSWPMKRPL
jgi:spore germination protein GerM